MASCEHIQHHGLRACPGLTEAERQFGEKVRSIGFGWGPDGKAGFHGDHGTIRERTEEMFQNAARYGNEPPNYEGPRSKMRPYSELKSEIK